MYVPIILVQLSIKKLSFKSNTIFVWNCVWERESLKIVDMDEGWESLCVYFCSWKGINEQWSFGLIVGVCVRKWSIIYNGSLDNAFDRHP